MIIIGTITVRAIVLTNPVGEAMVLLPEREYDIVDVHAGWSGLEYVLVGRKLSIPAPEVIRVEWRNNGNATIGSEG